MHDKESLISLIEATQRLHIELELCREFADFGLIHIVSEHDAEYIMERELSRLHQAANLYRDLGVNCEGVEIILSMREHIIELQEELERLNYEIQSLKKEHIQRDIEIPKKKGLFFEL